MPNWSRKFDVNPDNRRARNVVFDDDPATSTAVKSPAFLGKLPKWMKCGFFCSRPPTPNRVVWVGHRSPLPDRRSSGDGGGDHVPGRQTLTKPPKYPDNKITTSKYTLWNFIPRNLFEQFRRIANFYFLCMAAIQLILPDSPVSPFTSVAPLIFVVVVTALKQSYEDWRRHQSDNSLNNRKVIVIKSGLEHQVKSRDIKVGDIVKVTLNNEFPCDLVMLSSCEDNGECHITTASLDGESNLKIRYCVPETKSLMTAESLEGLVAVVTCPHPHSDLYSFKGVLELFLNGGRVVKKCPLSPENVLLKGASLKNTAFVYGCAIYTGQQTKMALNSKLTSNKFSTVERSMNIYLVIFLLVLVVEVAICSGLLYMFNSDPMVPSPWYFPPENISGGALSVLEHILSYIVLFNYTIPISMYVTIELQKFFGSLFFSWDLDLYEPRTGEFAKCNTSDLNEELGQVEYLFTDKTGTLTENDMQFRQCSIGGRRYIESDGFLRAFSADETGFGDPILMFDAEVGKFLLTLALCHTAHVSTAVPISNGVNGCHPNGSFSEALPEYQASSPDEKALLEACSRFGIIFRGMRNDVCGISYKKQQLKYERLQVLEFDSDRKCMSVIVRNPDGRIQLLCKGAENAVISRSDSGSREVTLEHVNSFAMLGLRTLVVATRDLSEEEYAKYEESIRDARSSLDNDREVRLGQLFESVERDLEIVGATAVEDQLQDGVPETLKALGEAGIKIWMLTGDKEETAVNISYSCQHFDRDMVLLYLTKQRDGNLCLQTLYHLKKKIQDESENRTFAMVVDGSSLAFTLTNNHHALFLEVTRVCKAVVCCRMSPLQKAQIVRLVKKNSPRPCTAAIGDGANDVSMIQEAHVGIGIMGKEGRHAVRCSDFAFARFRFLRRVLLVHGHYYYIRVTTLVQYFFYKNLGFITPQVYYVLFAGFTPQPLYDGMFLTFYNILFTSLPILVYGLFEQNIRQEQLIERPELYRTITRNAKLAHLEFLKWNSLAIWHSIVFFFSGILLFGSSGVLTSDGWVFGNWSLGTYVFHCAVITINIKLALESRYFTVIFIGSILVSIVGFMLFSMIYSGLTVWIVFSGTLSMFWVYYRVLASASVWLCSLLTIATALMPDLLFGTLAVHTDSMFRKRNPTTSGRPEDGCGDRRQSWFRLVFRKNSNNLTISQVNIVES